MEVWNNMNIIYKKLTEKELGVFIQMRITQLREEGATEKLDLVPNLEEYYKRHMADGTFVSWIALDGDKIIGTSGMSFVEKPPYFGCPSGKIGLLSSMFTDPAYRRKGIAKELLSRVIAEAKEYGCGTVQITASDMGVKLYTDFGFEHNQNFMQYNLQKKYNFWGWENSDTPTITDEYPGINTPKELYDALSHIWCAYTCTPRLKDSWTKENMTLGQCSITAFLVQDIFGGDVYGIRRPGGNYDCYNV